MNGKFPDKIFRRAVEHHQAGRMAEASEAYQDVLRKAPGHPPALHLLGVLAMQIGQPAVGVDLISAAIAAEPDNPVYRSDIGEALRQLGQMEEAAAAFEKAVALDPDNAAALTNLGMIRHAEGQLDAALALYRQAVLRAPSLAPAHMNMGVALLETGEAAEALKALQQSNRLSPGDPAILLNLGNAHLALGEAIPAEALYREGLKREATSVALEIGLARALRTQNRVAEALEHDTAAVALEPDLAQARWNQGLDHLLLGDLARGWEGFAWRWRANAVPSHGLTAPEWPGGGLEGRNLLVHAEQGLGDTLQFIRFLPALRRFDPASVTLLCQPAIKALLAAAPLADMPDLRVTGPEQPLPAHDLRIALLDLPLRLGITLGDLPSRTGYLEPPQERVAMWRDRLGASRIGLVWKGRSDHANDRNRSMPLSTLGPVLRDNPQRFVSLQKDPTEDERHLLAKFGVSDLSDDLPDLIEAASAIAALNLVIAVDTALAHLAGAMGKPCWVLLPFAPDWRWMLNRPDSPWYPSARLFRQPAPGDWGDVAGALKEALGSRKV